MLLALSAIGMIRQSYSKMNETIKYLTPKPSRGGRVLCSSLAHTRNL